MRVICFAFFWTVFTTASAHSTSNDHIVVFEEKESLISFYLKNLEELGYCVIPQVLTVAETEVLYQRVWHEYIEHVWPNCKMNDRANWKETFPKQDLYGICAGSADQIQVMWELQQDPRIINVFAKICNTRDLDVSRDGIAILCPEEIRPEHQEPWFHVDQTSIKSKNCDGQSLKTKSNFIRGQFLFEDSFSDEGGFYCIPKSHLRFDEFAPQLDVLTELEVTDEKKLHLRNNYLLNFFGLGKGKSENSYRLKHITAPRGSLILWDSRIVHWNQQASKGRQCKENSKVGMAGYLCCVPKETLTKSLSP